MLDGLGFKAVMQSWDLPQPGSNRGYGPERLIEQIIVSIWCEAARFVHADITRLDCTPIRLFGWSKAAGHKAIVRLFQRFDQASAKRVQLRRYQWLFSELGLGPVILNVDCHTHSSLFHENFEREATGGNLHRARVTVEAGPPHDPR